jgi:hypothetical protein
MSNDKKQTAVEWLIDWMGKTQYFIGNDLIQAVNEAKAMEREQIKDAYQSDRFPCSEEDSEQYYNETYGGDK